MKVNERERELEESQRERKGVRGKSTREKGS